VSFSWPWALLTLAVLPLLLAAWWLSRQRRKRAAVRVTSIALVAAAAAGRSRWRRRVPAGLLVAGLAVLAVGAARPQVSVPEATSDATIMLTIDVSGSMCSTDVKPNRIDAAEQSADAFIKSQTGGPRIGLVAFSSAAALLVPPTTSQQPLMTALSGLSPSGGTAIGDGILSSLDAIAQVDPSVAPTGATAKRSPEAGYADDVIVVLTDGSNNRGVDPQVAAKEAAARGVRVYTIGYGTDNPATLECDGVQYGTYGAGVAGSGMFADLGALMQISKTTGGRFFRAQDASQLSSALAKLPAAFTIVHRQQDVGAGFAALGGLFVAVAVGLSLWWNRARRRVSGPSS
jgi:Ca-activated chloride channel homolog